MADYTGQTVKKPLKTRMFQQCHQLFLTACLAVSPFFGGCSEYRPPGELFFTSGESAELDGDTLHLKGVRPVLWLADVPDATIPWDDFFVHPRFAEDSYWWQTKVESKGTTITWDDFLETWSLEKHGYAVLIWDSPVPPACRAHEPGDTPEIDPDTLSCVCNTQPACSDLEWDSGSANMAKDDCSAECSSTMTCNLEMRIVDTPARTVGTSTDSNHFSIKFTQLNRWPADGWSEGGPCTGKIEAPSLWWDTACLPTAVAEGRSSATFCVSFWYSFIGQE